MMNSTKRAVVLLSGGLDSATVLAIARSEGYELYALSFSYGQRHIVELDAARRVAMAIVVVAEVAAKPVTFKGTVVAIERTRVQVKLADAKADDVAVWFDITDKTKVTRAGKHEVFSDIHVKIGEAVTIVVNDGDEAGIQYRCPMDKDVVAAQPGKCPKCGMTLRKTDAAAKAAEIQFTK